MPLANLHAVMYTVNGADSTAPRIIAAALPRNSHGAGADAWLRAWFVTGRIIYGRCLPSLWTNSYFVSTVGGISQDTLKQCVESQKDK
jgi:REP element-mobilizing transposase RayT